MSGKPQYHEGAVIAAAIDVFWRHGYATASIHDLTEATGLSRSSLYLRFGDKDNLFRDALEVYTERVIKRMTSARADSARASVEAILRDFLPKPGASRRPAGCLLSRSSVELIDLAAAGKATALAGIARQREVFANLLREAVATGELGPESDVDALAWYYLGVLQAVLNFPQSGASSEVLEHMIDIAMSAWPEADQSASRNQ
ncbi:TetR/AcrR family transcriptional regulator [Paraburkholderia sp. SOS3]|uniref:TetR/AcrR family transcriptional regulator n=1 Tax=Paraburkholderia sp. SOS3 TaxID=1926494 RepID=UPI0009476F5F|nr:TetR/AcrR family transcriptional regulator [Paraburkholderia sp. SOS3]APR39156.1 TetR family transcriptional regulator [Paraburkholderia sp. SOS3]